MTAALFVLIAASLILGAWIGRAQARVNQQLLTGVRDVLIDHEAEADHDDNPTQLTPQ